MWVCLVSLCIIFGQKRGKTGLSVEDSAIFGGVFLAYFFNNLFVFDNLSSLILFVTILAYVNFRAKGLGVITQNEEIKADYGKAMSMPSL